MESDLVRVVSDGSFAGSRIEDAAGGQIDGVTGAVVTIADGKPPRVALEVRVSGLDILAHPLLGLETLKASAAVHGFALVPIDPAG